MNMSDLYLWLNMVNINCMNSVIIRVLYNFIWMSHETIYQGNNSSFYLLKNSRVMGWQNGMDEIGSFNLMSSVHSIAINRFAYANCTLIQNLHIFHETVITIPEVVTSVLLKSASLGRILSANKDNSTFPNVLFILVLPSFY